MLACRPRFVRSPVAAPNGGVVVRGCRFGRGLPKGISSAGDAAGRLSRAPV
jgi:hypothetical protein